MYLYFTKKQLGTIYASGMIKKHFKTSKHNTFVNENNDVIKI